ncbi:MAG: ABC transporter ATP-binding protein [Pseudomonadota bacterium]
MTELRANSVSVVRGDSILVERSSFTIATGELVALLGPNGAGKTTLLRAALGLIPLSAGEANLAGIETRKLSPAARARQVSYLPQRRPLAWPSPVRDVVALGRYAHGATLGRLSTADRNAVIRALESSNLLPLADRATDTLSGGELARVHFARAFAAEAPLLIADEPVAALDPRNQFLAMALVREFVDAGGGALVVLHDVEMAARFADRLIWMQGGKVVADGSPAETLTEERLAAVYGIKARVDGLSINIEGAS